MTVYTAIKGLIAALGALKPAFMKLGDTNSSRDDSMDLQPPRGLEEACSGQVKVCKAASSWKASKDMPLPVANTLPTASQTHSKAH